MIILNLKTLKMTEIEFGPVEGLIAQCIAFLLCTQLPQARFSAMPRIVLFDI